MEIEKPTAQFDLSLYLRERAGRLIGYFEYAADLFERATIERMAGHFQILLANIVEQTGKFDRDAADYNRRGAAPIADRVERHGCGLSARSLYSRTV